VTTLTWAYEGPEGQGLMMRVKPGGAHPGPDQSFFTLLAPRRRRPSGGPPRAVEAWMAEHPHLRGAKLDAHLQFLSSGAPLHLVRTSSSTRHPGRGGAGVGQFFARLPGTRNRASTQ